MVRRISVLDAFFGDDKVSPRSGGRGIHNFHFLATVDGHAPETGQITTLRVVDEFAVRGRLRRESAMMSELNRGAAFCGNFPDCPGAAAIRAIVDRISVRRPIGDTIFRVTAGNLPGLATLCVDHKDMAVARRARIENDLAAIGRPARRARQRAFEMSELDEVGA